ncbi:LuxR C-terminal-related transcriptional regulator, partial [Solirubrobacter phytolaccae]
RPDEARAAALEETRDAARRGVATFAAQALVAHGDTEAALAAANGHPWTLPDEPAATPAAAGAATGPPRADTESPSAHAESPPRAAASTAPRADTESPPQAAEDSPPAASAFVRLSPSPSPRARAEASFARGLALRQAGQRTEARRHLTDARDLAARHDLIALANRATEELVVAGGKPKRAAQSGAAALTPSERRMAEHAARGLSNREIAETLFVTRKTVEFTLGNAYSKLGIRSRTQLAEALTLG